MKKRVLTVLVTMVCLVLLSACGKTQVQTTPEKTENGYPMTLTDQAGREVTLNQKPEKLVSSYYITTSAMLALGLEDNIAGIESNPEKRSLYGLCAPKLMERTQVGSPKEFDLEVCASINPDLVVLPMRAKDYAEPLEKLGIPVMIVNPESQDLVFEMLTLLGEAAGCSDRAKQLCDYIREKTDFIKESVKDCEKPSVYLGGNSSFLSTASKGMYQNSLISLAGGVNVAGDIDDTYWVESSYEQILSWNPQVIAMASEASYSLEEVLTDSYLQDCQAVKDKKVFQIPKEYEDWDSSVPSGFLGAAYLANALHPEAVSTEQYEAMVKEYYETFYGFSGTEK